MLGGDEDDNSGSRCLAHAMVMAEMMLAGLVAMVMVVKACPRWACKKNNGDGGIAFNFFFYAYGTNTEIVV